MHQTCDHLDVGICWVRSPNSQSGSDNSPWRIKPYLDPLNSGPTPSTWVRLRELPTLCSSEEALLICREGTNQWLAWIPDYGEITLYSDQFEFE